MRYRPLIWLGLIVVTAVVLLTSGPVIARLITLLLILGIALQGLNIIAGLLGEVSLCHAALYGLGAYSSAYLSSKYSMPIPFSILIAIGISGIAAASLSLACWNIRSHYISFATIGIGEILQNSFRAAKTVTGGADGFANIPSPSLSGFLIEGPVRYGLFALAMAAITQLAFVGLEKSSLGLALRALRDDEVAARSVGVPVGPLRVLTFGLGGACAGLAGALYAHFDGFLGPESFSTALSILWFGVLVLGGLGSHGGAWRGAAILTIAQEAFRQYLNYQYLLFAGLLLIALNLGLKRLRCTSAKSNSDEEIRIMVNEMAIQPRSTLASTSEILRVENLGVSFGGIQALSDVSFKVLSGEVVCIVGPNGAGKTTLLNVVIGQIPPSSGIAHLAFDKAVKHSSPTTHARLGVARTFQVVRLFGSMSTREHFLVAANQARKRIIGKSPTTIADECIEACGLEFYADRPAIELPYALQRLVELGRAISMCPRLLVLDEPSAGMNDRERSELIRLIRAIRKSGIAVLLVVHDMDLVRDLADRVVALDTGRLIHEGDFESFRAARAVRNAYLGEAVVQ